MDKANINRRATVAVIRAAGDAQIAGGLVDAATAREIRIKDAEIKAVRLELDLHRDTRATNIEARLVCVRTKYAPRPRTAMQRIGDQIGVGIALACYLWEASRHGIGRQPCR